MQPSQLRAIPPLRSLWDPAVPPLGSGSSWISVLHPPLVPAAAGVAPKTCTAHPPHSLLAPLLAVSYPGPSHVPFSPPLPPTPFLVPRFASPSLLLWALICWAAAAPQNPGTETGRAKRVLIRVPPLTSLPISRSFSSASGLPGGLGRKGMAGNAEGIQSLSRPLRGQGDTPRAFHGSSCKDASQQWVLAHRAH